MTFPTFKPLAAALVGLTLTTGSALAQEVVKATTASDLIEAATAQEAGSRVFTADYFTQYVPRTALEMLSRIPGFQRDGGGNKRGLGQGGANVLINGNRLTGKSDDPFDQVSRISAQNVVRIEIVDGTSLNIPGLSGQVANIITKSTGMTGTWEWRPEWRTGLQANLLPGFVTISGERGDLAYTAKLKNDANRNGHWGPEARSDANGTLFETRDESGRYNGDNPGGSLNLTWTPKDDHIGNLNLEYNTYNSNNAVYSDVTAITARGADEQHFFSNAEDEWNAKIDGDYEFPVGDGKLKMIGYYRVEDSPTVSRFDVFDDRSGLVESTRFFRDADEGEAIARTEYSWFPSEGRDWQIGLEGVFNFLDVESKFVDLLNPPATADFDSVTRVEELRGEATITHSRSVSARWDLQASLGAEYSEITSDVTDIRAGTQNMQSQSFFRPKGFVSATYKPKDNFSIRTRVEREVGQLNFFDFVSSVSLDDNLNTVGNVNIVPSQSWVGEVEFDRQFAGGHSFKARVYGELISDLVDRIPIGVNGDAVGNIDSAKRYGVDFDVTLKGEQFGLEGMELNLEYDLRNSSVEDPVQGFTRRLNDDKKYYWSVSFRHDIPNTDWAWGVYSDQFRESPVYRLTTINEFRFEGPWAHAFVEHKDIFGLKVNASVRNLFDASDDFKRQIFTDRRDIGALDVIEDRTRPFDLFFRLTVSGTF